jgi:hypothetical protein
MQLVVLGERWRVRACEGGDGWGKYGGTRWRFSRKREETQEVLKLLFTVLGGLGKTLPLHIKGAPLLRVILTWRDECATTCFSTLISA